MEVNREEIQKIAVEAENLQRMQKTLKDQMVALNMSSLESSVTINSIAKLNEGDNSLVSLGSGVFIGAKIGSTDSIIIDVGAGVYAELAPQKAVEALKKRIDDSRNAAKKIEASLKRTQQSLIELEGKARKYIR